MVNFLRLNLFGLCLQQYGHMLGIVLTNFLEVEMQSIFLLPKYILMMMWTILFSCNALFLRIKTIICTKIELKSRDEVAIKYRNKRSGILHYKVIK